MRDLRAQSSLALVLVLLGAGAAGAAGPKNMIHGRPDFDSGWWDLGTGTLAITHGLAGSTEDYVVDLQLRDVGSALKNGVHARGLGGDERGNFGGEHVGAQVWQVDSSQIWIQRGADDEWAGQCRVRIWRAPVPDWDSGWVSLAAGMGQTLSHGLGGDSDDYVVDLMFRTGATVHQRFVGKDQYDSASGFQHRGVAWSALGTTSVRIHRGADDVFCDETRVRIFLRPEPSWDSGWQSLTQNSTKIIDHDLGGPWKISTSTCSCATPTMALVSTATTWEGTWPARPAPQAPGG